MGVTGSIGQNIAIRIVQRKVGQVAARMPELVEDLKTEIVVRTSQGRTVEGGNFAPYSPSYAKYRQRKGRGDAPVDLTFTGQMLQSLRTKVEATDTSVLARIYADPARVNRYGTATNNDLIRYNHSLRPFFGLSRSQIEWLKQQLSDALK